MLFVSTWGFANKSAFVSTLANSETLVVKALSHCCVWELRMKCSLIRWYTLTYARDKLGIGRIRFKLAGHTLSYAGHTQSTLFVHRHTLVIRRVRWSYADIRWSYTEYDGHTQSTLFVRRHTLAFVYICGHSRSKNTTHTLLISSIRYQYGMYTPNSVFSRAFCAYKNYFYEFSYATLTFLSYATV